MRSRSWLGVVVVALIAMLVWWFLRGEEEAPKTSSSTVSGTSSSSVTSASVPPAMVKARAEQPKPPSWFHKRHLPDRRIAGIVLLDGKPAAGATVTLQSALTLADHGTAVEVVTAADGKFDLGTWPAALYAVGARAPEAQAATKWVDLADPTVKLDPLELRMRTCNAKIDGTITDATGAPIADAVVRREGFIGARSDAKGAYSLCVPTGDIQLDYAAEGYGAVVLGIAVLGPVTQDVVLVPAASVAGTVIDEAGKPVGDAYVAVFPREMGRQRAGSRAAITDGAGAFRVESLTPGAYAVFAYAEGLVADSPSEVRAEVGTTNEVVVKVRGRARITGVVQAGDKPLEGVEVTAIRKSPSTRAQFPAKTQKDGSFVIDGVPLGEVVLSVAGFEVTAPGPLAIERAQTYDDIRVQVAAMATVKGRITRKGQPIEGARVCCAQARTSLKPDALTDAEGRYEMPGLPAGTYELFATSDDAGAYAKPTKFALGANETKTLDFELDLAGEIAGTVVDADGKPVPRVFVRWIEDKTQDQGYAVTDAAGRYRCKQMAGGGTYRSQVFANAETTTPFPPAPGTSYPTQEVKDGASVVENIEIAIDYKQLTIRGRVVDSAGQPVVDAQVRALAAPGNGGEPAFSSWLKLPTAVTDAEGDFTLRGLSPGTYALQGRSPDGGESVAPDVTAGATGVTLKIVRPGGIDGTLVGYGQGAVVYASLVGAPNSKLNPGTVDGASFTVNGLRPGRYLVNAQNMGEGDAAIVDVRAGERAKVTLTAGGKGTIEGTVLDFKSRQPVAGAACRVVMSAEGQQGLTNWDPRTAPTSDERGRVLIDPAPAGNVTVACAMPHWKRSHPAVDVNLANGSRASVTLLSVELASELPSTIGADFDWHRTAPRIASVAANSPAAKAGLLPGDLVTAVDGTSVETLNGPGVLFLIDGRAPGTEVTITIQRAGTKKTVTATTIPRTGG